MRWLNAPWRDTISRQASSPFDGDECISFRGVDLTPRAMPTHSLMTARVLARLLQVMEGPHRRRLMKVRCSLPEHPSRGIFDVVHVGVMAARRFNCARAVAVF